MNKELCFLILLIITLDVSAIGLRPVTKFVALVEEYGLKTDGSSISLIKTKRDINKSLSLLALYQDTIIDYDICN
jgi:hypothetical protein